jgi:hypothetical protein
MCTYFTTSIEDFGSGKQERERKREREKERERKKDDWDGRVRKRRIHRQQASGKECPFPHPIRSAVGTEQYSDTKSSQK